MHQLKIVILGAGNLAFHLAKALTEADHEIIQVLSRTINSGHNLAKWFDAEAITSFNKIRDDADLYIIAVSDKAISQIIEGFDFTNKNVVHTAGSVPLSIFNEEHQNYGVFYPLQTFTKIRKINFKEVPVCIEASNPNFELFLTQLAEQIAGSVWKINSLQRLQLHLAAVFANNFVNHLYSISNDIISKVNIDFKILQPLILETAKKVLELNPEKAQTGPAIRNDKESLEKHLELLSSTPEYQNIYKLITKDICLKHNVLIEE